MHHGRLSALSCKRIHIAGTDGKTDLLLSPSANPFHIGSEQGIHAGNAYHHYRRLFACAPFVLMYNTVHRIGNLLQMLSGNYIRLIHIQEEKAVFILRKLTNA